MCLSKSLFVILERHSRILKYFNWYQLLLLLLLIHRWYITDTPRTLRRRTGSATSCSRPRRYSTWAIRSTSSCTAWPAPITATPWRRSAIPAVPAAVAFRPPVVAPPRAPSDDSRGQRWDLPRTRGPPPARLLRSNPARSPCRPSDVVTAAARRNGAGTWRLIHFHWHPHWTDRRHIISAVMCIHDTAIRGTLAV